jgi:competence protein ComEA
VNDSPAPETSPFATIVAFVVVVMAIVGAGIVLLATRPQPAHITVIPPVPTATATPSETPSPVTVYVTGAVAKSGAMIALPPGSRVQQAIDAAGGATSNADLQRVNLAAPVHDGDQVDVPVRGVAVTRATPSGGQVIHVNTATVEELEMLPGVGPALAQAIVEYRTFHGPFKDLDALDAVDGIGPGLLGKLEPLIAFDG